MGEISVLTEFSLDDAVLLGSVNLRCTQFNQQFPLSISNGGTGAYNYIDACKKLGILRSETITFSGRDTLTLSKSINEYSYVIIRYWYNQYTPNLYNYTCFSTDVLGSTASHALSVCDRYSYGAPAIIVASALMYVSASGQTITLERNKGFIKWLSGTTSVQDNVRIDIISIIGYK